MIKTILTIIVILSTSVKCITENETTLLSVQVVFNHGVRTPLQSYPNNPNDIWAKYGTNFGQLTEIGMKQMYDYGVYLREKYSFLNPVYDRTRAWAIAADFDRNLQSAQMIMTGLFKQTAPTTWTTDPGFSSFFPIPVHTTPVALDNIFHRHAPCPRFVELQAEAKVLNKAKESDGEGLTWKMKCLSNLELSYYDLWKIGEKAILDKIYNLTVESYISSEIDRIQAARDDNFYVTYLYSMEQAKLLSGGLLNQIVNYFDRKISGTTQNEVYLYGGFEFYVGALQRLLGTTTTFTQPNFGASMVFELRKHNNGSHYVQTMYKDNDVYEPNNLKPVTIEGCEQFCPVEKFKSLVADKLVSNFDNACASKNSATSTAQITTLTNRVTTS